MTLQGYIRLPYHRMTPGPARSHQTTLPDTSIALGPARSPYSTLFTLGWPRALQGHTTQAAFPNGPQSGPSGAHLGPNFAQLGPNQGPHGMLLGQTTYPDPMVAHGPVRSPQTTLPEIYIQGRAFVKIINNTLKCTNVQLYRCNTDM